MRKVSISIIAALILFAGFSSCKKIVAAIFGGTDVNVPVVQVTIPTVIVVVPDEVSLGSYSQSINLDSIVRAHTAGAFGANAVNSVKVKQITLTITNPDPLNNLANFQSARVTLQSPSNNTPVEIFSVLFPDTYAATYTYTPTNSPELVSYLKGSTISYNVYGKIRRTTSKPLNMTVAVTLRAD